MKPDARASGIFFCPKYGRKSLGARTARPHERVSAKKLLRKDNTAVGAKGFQTLTRLCGRAVRAPSLKSFFLFDVFESVFKGSHRKQLMKYRYELFAISFDFFPNLPDKFRLSPATTADQKRAFF